MSSTVQYLYRVDADEHGIRVEVGIFDPNRWAKSVERGEATQAGGMSFGEVAEVRTSQIWDEARSTVAGNRANPKYAAQVSMGAIGSHDVATAKRRIDVYEQACKIAETITELLANGDTIISIGEWLDGYLAQDPTSPADVRFWADR